MLVRKTKWHTHTPLHRQLCILLWFKFFIKISIWYILRRDVYCIGIRSRKLEKGRVGVSLFRQATKSQIWAALGNCGQPTGVRSILPHRLSLSGWAPPTSTSVYVGGGSLYKLLSTAIVLDRSLLHRCCSAVWLLTDRSINRPSPFLDTWTSPLSTCHWAGSHWIHLLPIRCEELFFWPPLPPPPLPAHSGPDWLPIFRSSSPFPASLASTSPVSLLLNSSSNKITITQQLHMNKPLQRFMVWGLRS